MYIQFREFWEMLISCVSPSERNRDNFSTSLFNKLFASYTANHPLGSSMIGKLANNTRIFSHEFVAYYEEAGFKPLATDIQENVFPILLSPRAFAQSLTYRIHFDPDLEALLKYTGVGHIPENEGKVLEIEDKSLAEYIAKILLAIIRRQHHKSINQNPPDFPNWISLKDCYYVTGRSVPHPSRYFIGRNGELNILHSLLEQNQQVFVHGIHGIGKSDLVYQYCKEQQETYRKILYINYTGNLQRDLCTLQLIGQVPYSMDMFDSLLFALRSLGEDVLLVIDNLNSIDKQENDWAKILQCGCKLLITTRHDIPGLNSSVHWELDAIKDMRSLISLVKKITGNKNLNPETLAQIIKTLHKHTTAVVLLAELLKTGRYGLRKILMELNLRNLKDFITQHFWFGTKSDSFHGHLRFLFSLFRFNGAERDTLRNMVLVPENGIPLPMFEKWTELSQHCDAIDQLVVQSIICRDLIGDDADCQSRLYLKPLIRELACDEFTPSFTNCATLIRNTAQAMHLLMDSNEDPYLRQLCMEVIDWAKKDDIPAYIDYLHKSFELTARYNQSSDMQTIVDALAKELVCTSNGTNIDRALTLDYQATLRQNLAQAIASRHQAIGLLDLNQPEEKKLAAEILDRMAGNCVEIPDWDMARNYSDISWTLFQELNLLGNPEMFQAVCRRGPILCHTGAVYEGFALLQYLVKYLYDGKPYPTQEQLLLASSSPEAIDNAVSPQKSMAESIQCEKTNNIALYPSQNYLFVLTALADAYNAVGDREQAEKHTLLASKCLVDLVKQQNTKI